jgi:hydroxylaminobenzene mutase
MDIFPYQKKQSHNLLRLGVLLFLLGLLTGFALPAMKNPRMGLSSHMEGILNGIFLIAIGLLWQKLTLSDRILKITFWLLLYGTYVNWATVLFSAITGAGAMMSLSNPTMHGAPWQEAVVNFGLYSLSIAIVLACVFIIVGLKKVE